MVATEHQAETASTAETVVTERQEPQGLQVRKAQQVHKPQKSRSTQFYNSEVSNGGSKYKPNLSSNTKCFVVCSRDSEYSKRWYGHGRYCLHGRC